MCSVVLRICFIWVASVASTSSRFALTTIMWHLWHGVNFQSEIWPSIIVEYLSAENICCFVMLAFAYVRHTHH